MLLLIVVSLISLSIAGIVELTTPKSASALPPAMRIASDDAVRVIAPFAPNVKPGQRRVRPTYPSNSIFTLGDDRFASP